MRGYSDPPAEFGVRPLAIADGAFGRCQTAIFEGFEDGLFRGRDTGAAQTDLATLTAEDVDWDQKTIGFFRRKTGSVVQFRFGETVAAILQNLPRQGPLFLKFSTLASGERSNVFRRRCERLNITGVTLHSYRYAWAERAKMAGYPERYAQEALGHKSQAVHRSYAKRAKMLLPPLEDFEKNADGPTAPVGG